jgi:transposase
VLPFREADAAPPAVGPAESPTSPAGSSPTRTTSTTTRKRNSPRPANAARTWDALAGHFTEFAKILTGLHGDRLDDWITAVEADDQPDLHSFARGLKRVHDAVLNGLTMPWSSGVVEGNVNRMLKRQMYGRATFGLLCKRVLLC